MSEASAPAPQPDAPLKRRLVGHVMVGRPTPAGQRRVVVEASIEGVHQTLEQSGVIIVGSTRVWTRAAEAPPLSTADDVLAAMAKVTREPGALAALVDAWTAVRELRGSVS